MKLLSFTMCIEISRSDVERAIAAAEEALGTWLMSVSHDGHTLRASWVDQAASSRTVAATTAARVANGLARSLGYRPLVVCSALPTAIDPDWE